MLRIRPLFQALALFVMLARGLAAQPLHSTTDWNLQPSFKYDTLCALNVLSGDAYYLEY
jgi:hypothetical protein